MRPAPDISVVIPTNRGGELLRESVAAVMAQTLESWELIVVLDGCEPPVPWPDDDRITTVVQRNRGESVARNVGVARSTAELVAFVDDDDLMLPTRLARQVALLRAHPEAGLVHSQFDVIDIHGEVVQPGRSGDVQYADLLRGDVRVLMPTIAVRKEALVSVGAFNSTLRTGQDLDLIYRIAREYPICFDPSVLTHYRRHGSNASGDPLQAGINLRRILDVHHEWATARGKTDDAVAARTGIAWARRYGAMGALLSARAAWRERNMRACAHALSTAARMSPRQTLEDLVGNRVAIRRLWRAR